MMDSQKKVRSKPKGLNALKALKASGAAFAIAFVFGPDGDRLGCSHCVHSLDVRFNARAAASVYWAVKFFLDFYKCC